MVSDVSLGSWLQWSIKGMAGGQDLAAQNSSRTPPTWGPAAMEQHSSYSLCTLILGQFQSACPSWPLVSLLTWPEGAMFQARRLVSFDNVIPPWHPWPPYWEFSQIL